MNTTPDVIAAFCAHQRVIGRSQRTIDRRAWSLTLWARHLEARNATLTTATVEDLETFLARWPSPQSRYSICADVHQLYRYARRSRPTLADPTDRLDRIKVPRRAASPIHASEVRRLVAALDSPSDRLIVMLAAYAGLRTFEIAGLSGEDVDLDGRWLRVHGKGGHVDSIPIASPLAAELAGHDRGPLVAQSTAAAVGARIRRLLRRHGVVGRPHDLRHSFATEAVRTTNGNIVAVARLMRHAEVATTMRYVRPEFDLHAIVDRLYADVQRAA